jgi:hypothetical protein
MARDRGRAELEQARQAAPTTPFHETECDRCHQIVPGTGKQDARRGLPDGWHWFGVCWDDPPHPPWAPGNSLDPVFCPACIPLVTLADVMRMAAEVEVTA